MKFKEDFESLLEVGSLCLPFDYDLQSCHLSVYPHSGLELILSFIEGPPRLSEDDRVF